MSVLLEDVLDRLGIIARMSECLSRAEADRHAYRRRAITAREFAYGYCREIRWYVLLKRQL